MRTLVLAACALALLSRPSVARTWHVPAEVPTIAAGLAAAAPGDFVEVACGTYHEHDLAMRPGVALRSETGAPDCVTIDGDGLGSVIVCEAVAVLATIEGFTLTHGFAQGLYPSGGGLVCRTSALAVRRCRFEANVAGWGGGLHAQDSRLTVTDCLFTGNQAHVGASAIDCTGGASTFANCEVTANQSLATSSAVRVAHAAAGFAGCRITGNDLAASAVVFVGLDSRLSLNGCTLADQPAAGVVGLFLQNARLAGSDNLIVGLGGPAIRAEYGASVVLDHATIAANGDGVVIAEDAAAALNECLVAFNGGAGISVANAAANVNCCDVFGNGGGDYVGEIDDQTGLAGNISADPLFCDLAGGDLRLVAGSPALPPGNLCFARMGARDQGCGATAVPSASLPAANLLPARPNPCNPRTTLSFSLATAAPVRLEIFALDGTRVARLIEGPRPAGIHEVSWDGRDQRDQDVPTGIYLVRLTAGGVDSRQRLALVR
jgi:hypothetical protein